MNKTFLFDLGAVLLFPKDINYKGKLNPLHKELSKKKDYKFLDHFELNHQLLSYLSSIKSKFNLYMLTSGTIQNEPEIKEDLDKVFSEIFSTKELGFTKLDANGYLTVSKIINKDPKEITFVDDSELNCTAAKNAGMKIVIFKNNSQIINFLNKQ
jgi:FMN phosphatase YigB (HAD superfamily)